MHNRIIFTCLLLVAGTNLMIYSAVRYSTTHELLTSATSEVAGYLWTISGQKPPTEPAVASAQGKLYKGLRDLGGENYYWGEAAVILGFVGFLLAFSGLLLFQRPIQKLLLSISEAERGSSPFSAIAGAVIPTVLLLAVLYFCCISFGHTFASWLANGSPNRIPLATRILLRVVWFLSGPGFLVLPAAMLANAIVGWQFTKARAAVSLTRWLRIGTWTVGLAGFCLFWALYKPFLWIKSLTIINS